MFNRSKRAWQEAAVLQAIEEGKIDGEGVIRSDHDEERSHEWIDDIFCIDKEGEAI